MTASQPALELRDLMLRRGDALLDVPSLSLEEGHVLALIGPNGAGKSTLLLAVASLLKTQRGTLIFKGQRIDISRDAFAYRRRLAMVFQEPLLFDTTVYANVASGLKIRGVGKAERERIVHQNLERFGIAGLAARSARKLSGGEAQRTSLARAFATEPEMILLDEPFSALDAPTRESLTDDLQRILAETRTTAIFTTHDRWEALRLADEIAVMNNGTIVQVGLPEEVMNQPRDEFVASFVGMETILAGRVQENREGDLLISVSGHEVEALGTARPGENVMCCIRPENVTISADHPESRTSARNVFPGKVTKITSLGLFQKVNLDCGFFLVAYVTRQSCENLGLEEGREITASFKATAVHVIKRDK